MQPGPVIVIIQCYRYGCPLINGLFQRVLYEVVFIRCKYGVVRQPLVLRPLFPRLFYFVLFFRSRSRRKQVIGGPKWLGETWRTIFMNISYGHTSCSNNVTSSYVVPSSLIFSPPERSLLSFIPPSPPHPLVEVI